MRFVIQASENTLSMEHYLIEKVSALISETEMGIMKKSNYEK